MPQLRFKLKILLISNCRFRRQTPPSLPSPGEEVFVTLTRPTTTIPFFVKRAVLPSLEQQEVVEAVVFHLNLFDLLPLRRLWVDQAKFPSTTQYSPLPPIRPIRPSPFRSTETDLLPPPPHTPVVVEVVGVAVNHPPVPPPFPTTTRSSPSSKHLLNSWRKSCIPSSSNNLSKILVVTMALEAAAEWGMVGFNANLVITAVCTLRHTAWTALNQQFLPLFEPRQSQHQPTLLGRG